MPKMPYCRSCRSFHVVPRSAETLVALCCYNPTYVDALASKRQQAPASADNAKRAEGLWFGAVNRNQTHDSVWEGVGMMAGGGVALLIANQWYAEMMNPAPSTLGYTYLFGFLGVQAFWVAYGLRNKRLAIWSTNLACAVFQVALIITVLGGG